MNNGWIKLHRQFRESPYYKIGAAMQTWVECLLRATHEKHEVFLKRQKVTLLPGQFVMGRKEFGETIGVSGSTAWFWMQQFKADNMVDINTTNKGSLVTIKKWDEYQKVDSEVDNRKTTDEQQKNTYKNGNNDKKEKKSYVCRSETESLFISIEEICKKYGLQNSVKKKSLDVVVERYVGKIQMKVELQHCVSWLIDKNLKMISTQRIGNWFKTALKIQKREQLRQLEKNSGVKINIDHIDQSVDHFSSSPFADGNN